MGLVSRGKGNEIRSREKLCNRFRHLALALSLTLLAIPPSSSLVGLLPLAPLPHAPVRTIILGGLRCSQSSSGRPTVTLKIAVDMNWAVDDAALSAKRFTCVFRSRHPSCFRCHHNGNGSCPPPFAPSDILLNTFGSTVASRLTACSAMRTWQLTPAARYVTSHPRPMQAI